MWLNVGKRTPDALFDDLGGLHADVGKIDHSKDDRLVGKLGEDRDVEM